ncbi:hypothetical protein KSP40_PGU000551 [Platanthera guangdongensis]|uniref:Uncharacterized protein n=1 Tax=Platanthera guangdongensis TaxID=2320717 RepID=A0ABR2LCQ1_9ASPA
MTSTHCSSISLTTKSLRASSPEAASSTSHSASCSAGPHSTGYRSAGPYSVGPRYAGFCSAASDHIDASAAAHYSIGHTGRIAMVASHHTAIPASSAKPIPSTDHGFSNHLPNVVQFVAASSVPPDPFIVSIAVHSAILPFLPPAAPPDQPATLLQSLVILTPTLLHITANANANTTRYQALFWREIKEPDESIILLEFELEDKLDLKDGWSVMDFTVLVL